MKSMLKILYYHTYETMYQVLIYNLSFSRLDYYFDNSEVAGYYNDAQHKQGKKKPFMIWV